jgi:hypothetical protein
VRLPDWATGGRMIAAPPAYRTLLKCLGVPRVGGEQRTRVLRFEAEQLVGGALAEAVWDHAPVAEGEPEREVVMVMKLAAADRFCAEVERRGSAVDRIVPAGWALVLALRHNYPDLKKPAVVVWLDGRTVLLVRVERADVAMRLVGLPEPDAVREPALVQVATEAAPREQPAARSAVPWLDRVAVEIARLAASESGEPRAEAVEVFLGGDGVEPGTVTDLAVRVAAPVNGFDALRRVRLERRAQASDVASLRLGVVVGLALAARRPGGVDLLPPASRRARRFRRNRWRWLTAAGAVVVALIVPLLWLRQARLARVDAAGVLEVNLWPKREAERGRMAAESMREQLHQQMDSLAAIRAARSGWIELLADLQERLTQTEEVWIDSLAVPAAGSTSVANRQLFGHRETAVAGEAPPRGLPLAVTGCVLHRHGSDALDRVRLLRERLLTSRFVAAVEDERFDDTQPGLLRFGCTVVLKPEAAL